MVTSYKKTKINESKQRSNTVKKKYCLKICALFFIMILLINTLYFPVQAAEQNPSDSPIYYFGKTVTCGKDNGYIPNTESEWNPWTLLTPIGWVMGAIKDKDPHYGWELGKFYVRGYTGNYVSNQNSYSKDLTTFTKNVGDKIEFGFRLDQDINKLNGKSSLVISDDRKIIKDCWIKEPYFKADFRHGLLMIVHTDYQGNEKVITYVDFLNGIGQGANTKVELFEEGDYRVILCYEIYVKDGWNWITDWVDPNGSYFNYRMESCFSIRNGNCMVFPFEIDSNRELTNECLTEKGFRIDLAKSRYLNVTVKKEVLNETEDDLAFDTRFNKDVIDGAEFTDDGKYTISVTNPTTGAITEKVIYVGKNKVMKANAVTGKTISEINELVGNGYRITKNGELKRSFPTAIIVLLCVVLVAVIGVLAYFYKDKIKSILMRLRLIR